ncbi:hypothetical protein DY000_02007845 [Brassica cretica]|uniref:Uncharacterized protein n=1 Tax=Brassica cretica TaxID=69181 RepID=A0ABQ7C8M1_BRACR|nr:hypothetical protein DY000_02007845 [Brassica cretica]
MSSIQFWPFAELDWSSSVNGRAESVFDDRVCLFRRSDLEAFDSFFRSFPTSFSLMKRKFFSDAFSDVDFVVTDFDPNIYQTGMIVGRCKDVDIGSGSFGRRITRTRRRWVSVDPARPFAELGWSSSANGRAESVLGPARPFAELDWSSSVNGRAESVFDDRVCLFRRTDL